MRALNVSAAGEAPTLSDIPIPEVAPGTVLVEVVAAAYNPVDAAIAGGMVAGMMAHEYPVVIGRDAAGTVTAIGEGVDQFAIGDAVIGHVLFQPPIQAGTFADYALFPVETVTFIPEGLDFTEAAALPIAGATAFSAVEAIDPQPGEVVLVVGAAGGVGSFALQYLKARGATVLATGRPEDAGRLSGLGADQVIDHTAGDLAAQVRASHPDGADALIDLATRTAPDLPLPALRAGARIASTLGIADALSAQGFTGTNIMARPLATVVAPIAAKAAAGELKVDVENVVPLDQAGGFLARAGSHHAKGKTVIRVS